MWRRVAAYRMMRLDDFAEPVRAAFASDAIEAVLHYSQRSALAFVRAAQRAGLEISALALPQLCLSEPIAAGTARRRCEPPGRRQGADRGGFARALEGVLRGKRGDQAPFAICQGYPVFSCHPAKAGIQYAAASAIESLPLWNLDATLSRA